MSHFEYAWGGCPTPREFYVAAATAIEKGEVVKFTSATGIASADGTDLDDPSVGIGGEAHDGATAGRQSGTVIKVYADPENVFRLKSTNVLTLTDGSTTTAVIAGLLPATDDLWNGGYIQIVSCAANSGLNGRKVKISDSTGSTGTLTLNETLPSALAASDTIYLCPGPLAMGEYGWDLVSGNCDIDWDTSGGEGIMLVDTKPELMETFWKFRLHQFASYMKAI